MSKPNELKVKWYAARMIKIIDHLGVLPRENVGEKISETKLNAFLFWIVCQMDGVSKCMCRVFTVNILLKKGTNNIEHMEIVAYIYEGFVVTSSNFLLEQMLTVLVTAGKWEENLPCQKLTLRQVNALESARKGM